jgi:hypothetical protein
MPHGAYETPGKAFECSIGLMAVEILKKPILL